MELLVAALVVFILFIAASPFYRAARSEASRLRCETARQLIADAQERFRRESAGHRYARDLSELAEILPTIPQCPSGGHYRFRISDELDRSADGTFIGPGRMVILCSSAGHRLFVLPNPKQEAAQR